MKSFSAQIVSPEDFLAFGVQNLWTSNLPFTHRQKTLENCYMNIFTCNGVIIFMQLFSVNFFS